MYRYLFRGHSLSSTCDDPRCKSLGYRKTQLRHVTRGKVRARSAAVGARVTTQCLILLTLDNNVMRVFFTDNLKRMDTNPPNDTTDFTHDKEGLSYISLQSYSSLH